MKSEQIYEETILNVAKKSIIRTSKDLPEFDQIVLTYLGRYTGSYKLHICLHTLVGTQGRINFIYVNIPW